LARLRLCLAGQPQDVVQRIAVTVQVEHRGEFRRGSTRRCVAGTAAAEEPPQQAAESAAKLYFFSALGARETTWGTSRTIESVELTLISIPRFIT
jgi:hypothetical protein